MNQQQTEQLEMRLTRIENQLTHILCVLLGSSSNGRLGEEPASAQMPITGVTTRRVLTPNTGDKYGSWNP
ncbi:hypothetical protein [Pseudomonas monteilii]|uniref:hypothetical protein n=1 Tax=Pseudomonas monteilii TaxID=76759 RepID=UPI00383BC4F3